jgi:adenylyltransferase/sulfurtransferase
MNNTIDLQPQELKERLDRGDDVFLLDVREPWEHALASLPDSVLIPLGQLHHNLEEMDPDAEIVAYCHHGIRSLQAVAFLKNFGLKKVKHLAGGIDAWSRQVDPSVRRY